MREDQRLDTGGVLEKGPEVCLCPGWAHGYRDNRNLRWVWRDLKVGETWASSLGKAKEAQTWERTQVHVWAGGTERKLWVVCLSREGLGESQGASYRGREQRDFPMFLSSLSCSWHCNTSGKVCLGRDGWWNQRLKASATRAGSTDCLKGWQLGWVSPRAQTAPSSFCKDPKWTPTQNLDSSAAEE